MFECESGIMFRHAQIKLHTKRAGENYCFRHYFNIFKVSYWWYIHNALEKFSTCVYFVPNFELVKLLTALPQYNGIHKLSKKAKQRNLITNSLFFLYTFHIIYAKGHSFSVLTMYKRAIGNMKNHQRIFTI